MEFDGIGSFHLLFTRECRTPTLCVSIEFYRHLQSGVVPENLSLTFSSWWNNRDHFDGIFKDLSFRHSLENVCFTKIMFSECVFIFVGEGEGLLTRFHFAKILYIQNVFLLLWFFLKFHIKAKHQYAPFLSLNNHSKFKKTIFFYSTITFIAVGGWKFISHPKNHVI